MSQKILLVEDEAVVALVESRTIQKHGYEVAIAYSGERAVEAVESDAEISLVLMDIDLGEGIDGTEAARLILQEREIPIVFLTSHMEKEYVNKVKSISRYGYVLKNSGEFVLIEAINMACELFRAHRSTREQERQYRSLMHNSPFGVSVINKDARFLTANAVMAEILETDQESIVGRPVSAFFDPEEYTLRLERLNKVIEDGKPRSFEISRGDRVYNTTVVPDLTDQRRIVQIIAEDVTERRRETESLVRLSEELSAIYEHTPQMMILLDQDLRLLKANTSSQEYAGSASSELIGAGVGEVLRCIHSLDNPRGCGFGEFCRYCPVRKTIVQSLDSGIASKRVEAEIPRKIGGEHRTSNLLVSTFPMTLHGEPRLIVSIEDVSEARETEAKLSESLSKYRGLFNSIRDAILVADTDRTITNCNPAFSDLFGYSLEELRGKKTESVYENQEEYSRMGEAIKRHRGNMADFLVTVNYRRKDGSVFPGETNVFYLHDESGQVTGFIGLIRDVGARLESERKLLKSEKDLRITLNSIGDAVISTDTDGQVVRMNPVAERLSGWSREEASGIAIEKVLHLVHGGSHRAVANPVETVLRTGQTVSLANHTVLLAKNGREYQIADSAAPIMDETGEITGTVLVFRDISETYEKQRRLNTLMEHLPGMAYRCANDRSWKMEFVSAGCLPLTGYSKDELENNSVISYGDLIYPDDQELVWRTVQEALSRSVSFSVRYRIRTRNDEVRWVWEQGVGIKSIDGGTPHIEGFITDISAEVRARNALETALREKDFLMKELNHRVKNNLAMVSSLISLKNSESEDDLSDLMHRVDAVRLVHEKLHQTDRVNRIQMRQYVQDVLDTIFTSLSGREVQIKNSVEEIYLRPETAVPIGLIVNELATNAIQHGFNSTDQARFSVHTEKDRDSYLLVVSNTGNEFPHDVGFDNARTLGLQLIWSLVAQLKGTIKLERKPVTTFTIRIPAGVIPG